MTVGLGIATGWVVEGGRVVWAGRSSCLGQVWVFWVDGELAVVEGGMGGV